MPKGCMRMSILLEIFLRMMGDAGNKWVEKHLQADKDALMQVIAKEFKRIAKT